MQMDIRRSLTLLFAGALAGVMGGVIVQTGGLSQLATILIIIVSLLILLGVGVPSLAIYHYHLRARKRKPRIGILNDMQWSLEDEQIRTWTDISPQVWLQDTEKYIKEKDVKATVKMIKTTDNFEPYTVVINPYGGVYPEEDLVSFTTLDKILKYVQEGGLFVNVADIPGYWAYNPLLKKRTEAAPAVWDVVHTQDGKIVLRALRPFPMVPWMKRLGLGVVNVESTFRNALNLDSEAKFKQIIGSEIQGLRLHRLAFLEKNVESVHKAILLLDEAGQPTELTSIFFATYKDGAFLISLISIESQIESTKEMLKKVIIGLVLLKI